MIWWTCCMNACWLYDVSAVSDSWLHKCMFYPNAFSLAFCFQQFYACTCSWGSYPGWFKLVVASSLSARGMGTWQHGIRDFGCSNGCLWAKKMQWQKVELPSLFDRAVASFKNCLSVWTVGRIGGIDFRCSGRFNLFPFTVADGEAIPHPTWKTADSRHDRRKTNLWKFV